MSTTVVYNITDWNNAMAAILILLNSCIGLLMNIMIIYNFITDKKQKNSFNVICIIRAANNIFVLGAAYLCVFLPTIILGYSIYHPFTETIIIAVALNCNLLNQLQGIFFSFNRLFAIYFPLKYSFFCKIELTILFHFCLYANYIYAVTTEMVDRYENSFYLLFSVPYLAYGGLQRTPDVMILWAFIHMAIPMAINAFTFLKYYHLKRRINRNSERYKQAKKNMTQFLQIVLQDSLYSISIIFNMKLNVLFEHRLWTFFCQTFVWQSLHVLDGFIMLMFNDRLTLLKKSFIARISPVQSERQQPKDMTPPTVVL